MSFLSLSGLFMMLQPQGAETRGLAPEPIQPILIPEGMGWMDIAAVCAVMGGLYAFLTRLIVGPMIDKKFMEAIEEFRKEIETNRDQVNREIQRVDKSYHDFKDMLMGYFMKKENKL